jgi:hypothetical protein
MGLGICLTDRPLNSPAVTVASSPGTKQANMLHSAGMHRHKRSSRQKLLSLLIALTSLQA